MKIIAKRSLAWLMTLMMCVTLFCGVWTPAQAATVNYVKDGSYIYNWGTREQVATYLSPMAEDWYADNDTSYAELSALSGSSNTNSVTSSALYKALHELMESNHKNITSYDDTRPLFQYTDCQNSGKGSKTISSFYSGKAIGPEWDSGKTWNREHVWPNSKGSGNGENDIMMLRPTASSENSSRGNKAYGESSSYYNPNAASGEQHDLRGDVSRIVLYQYVRWEQSPLWGSSGVMESLSVLLKWVTEDPVDTWELGRNDSVEAITGTRNVFVDYPELVFILFSADIPANYTSPSGEGANGSGNCKHNLLACGATCSECGTYTKQHSYKNSCVAVCENGCGTANPNYTGHAYAGQYDDTCDNCGEKRTVNLPAAGTYLSIADAIAIGTPMTHNTTTSDKYYVTGKVKSITDTTFGNLYLQDDAGNEIYVYGTYDATGTNRFDAMAEKPEVGMTITVYGVVGNYNGPQLKNVWVTDLSADCDHVFDDNCDATCNQGCGYTRTPQHDYVLVSTVAASCTKTGTKTYQCADCDDTKTEVIDLIAHTYVNGKCSVCGRQKPNGYTAITKKEQLVTGQYVLMVNTGYAPTSLDGTWVNTAQPAMDGNAIAADGAADFLWTLTVNGTSVKLQDANGTYIAPKGGENNGIKSGEYDWAWTFENGLFVFAGVGEDKVYFASNPSTTANTGGFNRFRGYKTSTVEGHPESYPYQFTLYAVAASEPECEHEDAHSVAGKDATCTDAGYTAGVYCPDCDIYISGHETIPAIGEHAYESAVTTAPGCGSAGVKAYTCKVCGHNYTEEIAATGEHTYANACDADCNVCGATRTPAAHVYESAVTTAPGCGSAGVKTYTCKVCGHSYTEAVDATGNHTYANDCDADCNVCGATRTPADHVYFGKVTTAPTCSTKGVKTYTCAECGDVKTEEVATNNSHTYDNACDASCNACGATRTPADHVYRSKVTTAATCGADGVRTYTCAMCGDVYTAAIPATGAHTYDNACDANCNGCNAARVPADHVYSAVITTAPTCGTEGVRTYTCRFCSHSYTETVAATALHMYTNACDLDCDVCGSVRDIEPHTYSNACDKECNICGATRLVPSHVYDHACDVDCNVCGVTRKPAAHAYDNDCDTTCNVCAAAREVGPHKYVDEITTAPTCSTDGVCTYTCSSCSVSYTEVVPGGHTYDNAYDADCNVCGTTREVVPTVQGDVNGDAKLSVLDVAVLQQYVNGWDVSIYIVTADINGDGKLNNRDLVLAARLVAGWTI